MTILVNNSETEAGPAPVEATGDSPPPAGPDDYGPAPEKGLAKRLAPLAVLLAGAAVLTALSLWPAGAGPVIESAPLPPVKVKVLPLVGKTQPDEIRLPAVLEPYRTVKVAAEVAGRVEKIGPEEGHDVKPDEPLAWLNADLIEAAHEQAKAKHELDSRELRRYEALDGRGVATDIEMFRARAATAISKAVLKEVAERLERTVIRSPMAGVLNDMIVEPGEFIGAGKQIAEVVEVDQLKAIVNLPERDVVKTRVGQEVRILIDSLPDLDLTGTVTYIDACGDERCRTFRTEVTVDNRTRRTRAGLIVRVAFTRRVIEAAIMIPLFSVIPTEEGYQVYVVDDGKARSRSVEIGLIVGDNVEAKGGLKSGENLIVDGHRLVGDGSPVEVVE